MRQKFQANGEVEYSLLKGELAGTVVHVAINNVYAGYILIADEVKPDSVHAIKRLKAANIKHMAMLTGDTEKAASKVASELGIDRVYAQLLPEGKVEKVEELFGQKTAKGMLAFVGDGINDAPVLARADIGIAMGALGSDAAIEAADIVIMTDEPTKISTAMKISRKTLRIAYQNIVFAIGIKILVLVLVPWVWLQCGGNICRCRCYCHCSIECFKGANVKDL